MINFECYTNKPNAYLEQYPHNGWTLSRENQKYPGEVVLVQLNRHVHGRAFDSLVSD